MKEESIKLNSCPFCGKDPEYSKKFLAVLGKHMIECSSPDCAVVFFGTTYEDVADKWNNRQPTSAELITRINASIKKLEEWRAFIQARAVSHSDRTSTHVSAVVDALTKAIELLKNI